MVLFYFILVFLVSWLVVQENTYIAYVPIQHKKTLQLLCRAWANTISIFKPWLSALKQFEAHFYMNRLCNVFIQFNNLFFIIPNISLTNAIKCNCTSKEVPCQCIGQGFIDFPCYRKNKEDIPGSFLPEA